MADHDLAFRLRDLAELLGELDKTTSSLHHALVRPPYSPDDAGISQRLIWIHESTRRSEVYLKGIAFWTAVIGIAAIAAIWHWW